MKYGLWEDENQNSERKWKLSVENDIATLKEEVLTLKQQLKSSSDIINLLVHKNPTESSMKEISRCSTSIKKDESNNIKNNDHECIQLRIEAPVKIKLHHSVFEKTTPEQPLFTHYKPTAVKEVGDILVHKQICCLTAMPEYTIWSQEELRLAFYNTAHQKDGQLLCNNGLKGVMTGTGFVRYSPLWDYDPITKKSYNIHCISEKPCFLGKSLEELRLEDYVLKGINISRQNTPFGNSQVLKPSEKMAIHNSHKEELLNTIISQLKQMDTKLNSVNSHMSTVDSNVSEIRSQMSMIDSRLSAIDMFVTIQQMDKKWQGLSSSLQSLEEKQIKTTPSTNNNTQSPCVSKKTPLKTIRSSKCTVKNDLSEQRRFIATEDTILISDLPMSFINWQSNIKSAESLILKTNEERLKDNKLKPDNPTPKGRDSGELNRAPPSPKLKTKGSNIALQPDYSKEDDFVIVDKSDVDLCGGSPSDSKSITDNNITEFLEVKTGKRKDLVYEFGCEAQPDCLIESDLDSNSQDTSEPNGSGFKDYLFLLSFNDLEEANAAQQSPPSSPQQVTTSQTEDLNK